MSEVDDEQDYCISFPLELVIAQTPVSAQASGTKAKDEWKKTVGERAKAEIDRLRDWYDIDDRPLMATIYYFPPGKMQGDIDNIIKPILDGMIGVVYLDDAVIEKVVAQKFEVGIDWKFSSPSSALQDAIDRDKPVVYIMVEDDLDWREVQ
ncbi:RusA family crossover junction endodeoxyribonuclease [Roseomonas elaeocarpi]|uniref:RusA family crossover junction endodeoxyribonuclease n=1 Tax=Roseomonas elaeocarpi TaxID=907779 RepID=A0ABV6JVE6_9PROT